MVALRPGDLVTIRDGAGVVLWKKNLSNGILTTGDEAGFALESEIGLMLAIVDDGCLVLFDQKLGWSKHEWFKAAKPW